MLLYTFDIMLTAAAKLVVVITFYSGINCSSSSAGAKTDHVLSIIWGWKLECWGRNLYPYSPEIEP